VSRWKEGVTAIVRGHASGLLLPESLAQEQPLERSDVLGRTSDVDAELNLENGATLPVRLVRVRFVLVDKRGVVAPRDPREFDQRDEGRSIARAACRGARVAGGRRSPRLAVLAALRAAARGRRDSLPRRCAPSTGSLRGRWTRGMPRAGAQSLGMLTALACGLLRADAKTPRRSPARGSAA
jgi:hypothetical protein